MKNHLIITTIILFISTSISFAQSVQDFKVKTLGPANLNYKKSPKRVLIGDFQVKYQTALNLEDEKKGGKMWRGGIKGDAKASLTLVLDGLEPDNLQTLTDQLYQQYVSNLKAQGFEIVPIEELWNHKVYEKNRDKRWELKAGAGPEQGDEFGMILTRPSIQKFVVAKNTVDPKMPGNMSVLTDYEENTERKLSMQKNDFIFNKVVIVVSAFEDGQSETSKSLNRAAGYAQVKAETNFKISEASTNKFDMGTMMVKSGVEVANVLEKQKFDASQGADVDKRGTDIGVLRVWKVEDQEDINLSVVECNPTKYINGSKIGAEAFLTNTAEAMIQKSK